MNRGLMFTRKDPSPGGSPYPFRCFFEWLGPVVETCGYLLVIIGFALGVVRFSVSSLCCCAGFAAYWLSTCALLLEEISFHLYKRPASHPRAVRDRGAGEFWIPQLNTLEDGGGVPASAPGAAHGRQAQAGLSR